ncbi:hypothetical protein RB195_009973 [Necator americanus]|uniref:Uncharacterized protein n=1 Tax=Necator americanus TaxID=51031 RepID=A0ABR1CWY4_NECAM
MVVIGFLILICLKRRPFCVPPTSRDLDQAEMFKPKQDAVGRVISKQGTISAKSAGFSFKDHGDDIGTDMSEEKGPQSKPEEENTAKAQKPFDVEKVVKTLTFEDPEPVQAPDENNANDCEKRLSHSKSAKKNQTDTGD